MKREDAKNILSFKASFEVENMVDAEVIIGELLALGAKFEENTWYFTDKKTNFPYSTSSPHKVIN